MYYKGVIVEVLDDCVILLTDDGEFIKIHKKDDVAIGQAILCLPEDVVIENVVPFRRKKSVMIPMLMAVAACLLFVFMPGTAMQPYAFLSIDVNPSLVFDLDEDKKIVGVRALNQDAKDERLEALVGLTLDEGLQQFKQLVADETLSSQSEAMLFSLSFANEVDVAYEQAIVTTLEASLVTEEFIYFKLSKEEYDKANEDLISGGRYKAREITQEEQVESMSVSEIIKLMTETKAPVDLHMLDGEIVEEILDEVEDAIEDVLDEEHEDDTDSDESDDEDEDDNLSEEDDDDIEEIEATQDEEDDASDDDSIDTDSDDDDDDLDERDDEDEDEEVMTQEEEIVEISDEEIDEEDENDSDDESQDNDEDEDNTDDENQPEDEA